MVDTTASPVPYRMVFGVADTKDASASTKTELGYGDAEGAAGAGTAVVVEGAGFVTEVVLA